MAKFVVLNSMLKSILNYSGKWINTRQHSDVQVFTHWHSKIALPPLLQGQCRPFTSSPVPPPPLQQMQPFPPLLMPLPRLPPPSEEKDPLLHLVRQGQLRLERLLRLAASLFNCPRLFSKFVLARPSVWLSLETSKAKAEPLASHNALIFQVYW